MAKFKPKSEVDSILIGGQVEINLDWQKHFMILFHFCRAQSFYLWQETFLPLLGVAQMLVL